MKKIIPLIMGLMLPLAGAFADSFTDEAVEFCRSKGGSYSMGTMVEEGDKYCRQVTCKKTNGPDGRLEIPEGAAGPEANVEATKRVCVAKSVVDGSFNTNGAGNSAGSSSGSASGSASGAASGSGSGSTTAGSAAGVASGSGAGASGEAVVCEELEGAGVIESGMPCYKECKPRRSFLGIIGPKKSGLERESCVKCLLGHPSLYRVKKEYLPTDGKGNIIGDTSVSLGKGVSVKTGVIICKDANGKVVSVTGSACPSGMVIHTTAGAGSSAGVGAGGTIVISGGAVGSAVGGASGGIQRPAFCDSSKKKDLEACAEWMRVNARFLCASGGNPSLCMGGADAEISARYSTTDCVNCQVGSRKQSTWSGVAEVLGAIAPPLAQLGSAYFGARAYQKGQEAWAGAAAVGFEQCQISQNNYLQYLQANELPALTPAQQAAQNCNGYSLNQYAGLGGGMNGWYGAGYTPGFIGGMMGPYGGYNPYGMGGYVGGAVGGISGGYVGGYPGGYASGIAGGMVNGISIAGGINGGYAGGYNGGYVGGYVAGGYAAGGINGGYIGGYNGGYVAGGYAAGGYTPGGYIGGYNGGAVGGLVNGISIAGGINGGYVGGYAAGGYIAAGQVGGYTPGGYAGGFTGGYVAGGYAAGGYAAGGYAAGGYAAGGYAAGGYAGGYNPAATNYDQMMQQQGTMYQMSNLSGYGSAASYYPQNAGYTLSGQIGFGWQ